MLSSLCTCVLYVLLNVGVLHGRMFVIKCRLSGTLGAVLFSSLYLGNLGGIRFVLVNLLRSLLVTRRVLLKNVTSLVGAWDGTLLAGLSL